jgi:hypothetical protein
VRSTVRFDVALWSNEGDFERGGPDSGLQSPAAHYLVNEK